MTKALSRPTKHFDGNISYLFNEDYVLSSDKLIQSSKLCRMVKVKGSFG